MRTSGHRCSCLECFTAKPASAMTIQCLLPPPPQFAQKWEPFIMDPTWTHTWPGSCRSWRRSLLKVEQVQPPSPPHDWGMYADDYKGSSGPFRIRAVAITWTDRVLPSWTWVIPFGISVSLLSNLLIHVFQSRVTYIASFLLFNMLLLLLVTMATMWFSQQT